jgi:hypothetical protein
MNSLSFERGTRNTNNNLKPLFNSQRNIINSILSNTSRGGVQAAYFNNAFRNNPLQYAILNSNAVLYGIALGRNMNNGNTRYINVIGTRQGLGGKLMKEIKNNAKKNGKHYIKLSSVPRAAGFYRKQGFKNNKTASVQGLEPMIFTFKPLVVKIKKPGLRVRLVTPAGIRKKRPATRRR